MNIVIKMNFMGLASKVNEILYAIDSCTYRRVQEPLTIDCVEICSKEVREFAFSNSDGIWAVIERMARGQIAYILSFVIACARRNYIMAVVNLQKHIRPLVFVLPAWILQMGCGDIGPPKVDGTPLGDREVRGEFSTADENASQAEVVIWEVGQKLDPAISSSLGKPFKFNIQPGDISLLRNKTVFRGKVQETFAPSSGKSFLLHQVWPDEHSERMRFNNYNRLLRRDTLSLKDDVIRSVGDLLPIFALYDQDGEIITSDYFVGSVTVLNFIFTRCSVPEMCPATTNKMKNLQELAEKTKIKNVRFLSITLDPQYDSPGILKQYAQAYNLNEENFRLGTAEHSVIIDLARQFGILRKNDVKQTVDHTMRTMIVNGRRQIVYQVPGKGWSVEDFLSRLQDGSEG